MSAVVLLPNLWYCLSKQGKLFYIETFTRTLLTFMFSVSSRHGELAVSSPILRAIQLSSRGHLRRPRTLRKTQAL